MKEIKFLLMFGFALFFVVLGSCSRDSMNTARFLSDVVEREEELEDGRKCGIIVSTAMKIPPHYQFLTRPVLYLEGSRQQQEEELLNDFLKLNFRCLIGITDESGDVEAVDKLLNNIDHRLIVVFHEDDDGDNDDVNKATTTSNIFRVDSTFKVEVICPNCPKSVLHTHNKELIWLPERGFDIQEGSTNICCHPLKRQNLTISYTGVAPYIIYTDPLTGVDVEILKLLAEKFDFSYALKHETVAGVKLADGSWNGMMRAVKDGVSDMSIGHMAVTFDRFWAVRFVAAPYSLEYGFVAAKPKPLDPYTNVISVFQYSVWMGTLLGYFFTVIALITSDWVHKRIDGGDKSWKKRQKSDFFIIPLAVLTGQQVPLVFPKFSLGSVIFVSWIFTSLVLASSYQSMILAHLVAVNYEKPIRNTQDMIRSGRTFFIPANTALQYVMATSPLKPHRDLHQYSIDHDGIYSLGEGGIPLEVHQRLNLYGGAMILYREFNMTDYLFGEEILFSTSCGFMINRRKLWRTDFDVYIERFKAMGFIDKFKKDHDQTVKFGPESKEAIALSYDHVKSSVVFVFFGCGIAVAVFILEIRGEKFAMRRKRRGIATLKYWQTSPNSDHSRLETAEGGNG